VEELTIRPTAKYLKAGTLLTTLVVIGLEIAYGALWRGRETLNWVPVISPVLFLWPATRWVRRRFTRAVVSGDRLRYEIGVTSKSTRNIQLTKVQDIRVDQSFLQRLLGIGNISIETSGETSGLTIANVDRPQAVVEELMNRQDGAAAT
jgi:uncharacterized membrane protein YdbT with pleckstrin-like domain